MHEQQGDHKGDIISVPGQLLHAAISSVDLYFPLGHGLRSFVVAFSMYKK